MQKFLPPYPLEPPHAIPIARTPDGEVLVRPLSKHFFEVTRLPSDLDTTADPLFAVASTKDQHAGWLRFEGLMSVSWVRPGELSDVDLITSPPFPRRWLFWVLTELFGVDIFTHGWDPWSILGDHGAMPVVMPSGTWAEGWAQLARLEEEADLEPLKELAADQPRSKGQREFMGSLNAGIARLLESLPETVVTSIEELPARGAAGIGRWNLGLPGWFNKGVELSVYRQRQPDDSTAIGFHFFDDRAEGGSMGSALTLTDAMKKSGAWIEAGEEDAWYDRYVVNPEWIIDPAVLEPYELLDAPNPLTYHKPQFMEWLEATSS